MLDPHAFDAPELLSYLISSSDIFNQLQLWSIKLAGGGLSISSSDISNNTLLVTVFHADGLVVYTAVLFLTQLEVSAPRITSLVIMWMNYKY